MKLTSKKFLALPLALVPLVSSVGIVTEGDQGALFGSEENLFTMGVSNGLDIEVIS